MFKLVLCSLILVICLSQVSESFKLESLGKHNFILFIYLDLVCHSQIFGTFPSNILQGMTSKKTFNIQGLSECRLTESPIIRMSVIYKIKTKYVWNFFQKKFKI